MRATLAAMAAVCAVIAPPAQAGWYFSTAAKWASFAPRPEGEEATPNFYGYGGSLSTGYSMKQKFDLGGYGTYIPGRRKQAEFGKDDCTLASYGGEIAFRVAESVYLGFRGGLSLYRLYGEPEESELGGRWAGPSGGFSLGAVAKVTKQSFFQTTFDVMHHVLSGEAPEANVDKKRRFDSFSVSVAYMFNSYNAHLIENTIFKDFLDSFMFF